MQIKNIYIYGVSKIAEFFVTWEFYFYLKKNICKFLI